MIPDPLRFTVQALAHAGALVEPTPGGVDVMLPAELASGLGLPEELRLAASVCADDPDAVPCGLGTPMLERLVAQARAHVPVAHMRCDGVVRLDRARAVGERFVVRNGVTEVIATNPAEGRYLEAWLSWSAEADDRFEGLVRLMVDDAGGEPHPELRVDGLELREQPTRVPPATARSVLSWLAARVPAQLAPRLDTIREAALRRHQRDHHRVVEYFADLAAETGRRRKVDPAVLAAKLQHLVAERDAKLADLTPRYTLRVAVRLAAARWLTLPRAAVRLRLRRRKAERELELYLPIGAPGLDRVPCAVCMGATLAPAVCDDALHLLCERCVPSATGRVRCSACGARGPALPP